MSFERKIARKHNRPYVRRQRRLATKGYDAFLCGEGFNIAHFGEYLGNHKKKPQPKELRRVSETS
ncbi:MAG: hypothetical protein J5497_01860 [Selenomonadaceae bacterium]|nr:hypothetical protein [Selenomonadaceae bacterium]